MKRIPTLKSVMTPFPYSIEQAASVVQAQELMERHGIRHLPVKNSGELVGVVTDRDIKRAMDPSLGLPPKEELHVEDVMVADPYTVDVNERLDRVLLQLARRHIGCAIVVKEGSITGIFTTVDACRAFGYHLRSILPPDDSDGAA